MFVERCKQVVNVEIILTDRENDEHQVTVAILDPTLVNLVKIDLSMSDEEIKDKLIDDFQKHDFRYNKKQIMTPVIKLENQLLIHLILQK